MFIQNIAPSSYVTQNTIIEKTDIIINEKKMVLNELEIRQKLANLPEWITNGQAITTSYKFQNFIQAVEFINRLVAPSERAGHHPDLEISYNRVNIHLTTHDAGGITQKDFDLAIEISKIALDFDTN